MAASAGRNRKRRSRGLIEQLLPRARLRLGALRLARRHTHRPLRFEGPDGGALFVSPDMLCRGLWRVTYFDGELQPTGHLVPGSHQEAVLAVILELGGTLESCQVMGPPRLALRTPSLTQG